MHLAFVSLKTRTSEVLKSVKTISVDQEGVFAASSFNPTTFGISAGILLSWERGKEEVKNNICTALVLAVSHQGH